MRCPGLGSQGGLEQPLRLGLRREVLRHSRQRPTAFQAVTLHQKHHAICKDAFHGHVQMLFIIVIMYVRAKLKWVIGVSIAVFMATVGKLCTRPNPSR